MHYVTDASYLGGYKLQVRFENEEVRIVDLGKHLDGPVFEPLKDLAYFKRFEVNHDIEGHGEGQHAQLERLTRDLSLTPEQVEKISAALHTALGALASKFDPKHSAAHREAFAQAFASESFDAKTVMVNPKSNLAAHGSARMALFYETITPLLTPAQRATLAGHLREHASHQPTAISAK